MVFAKRKKPMAEGSPVPTPMSVYDGTRPLGEIEDWGRNDIRAWLGTGDERVMLGAYPDRRTAMRAVGAAAKAAEAAR